MKGTVYMSEERLATDESHATDEERQEGYSATVLRLLPAVTFGLRTAALAGLVVSAGAAAFGLTGPLDNVADAPFPTCCGGKIIEY